LPRSAEDLAASIVNRFFTLATDEVQHDDEHLKKAAEAARVASLTWALAAGSRVDIQEVINQSEIPFSGLSYTAESMGISEPEVRDIAKSCLERTRELDWSYDFSHLATTDLSDLLAGIHLVGSHGLITSERGLGIRRPLGVFYTPSAVSGFIVEQTLGNALDQIIRRIPEEGDVALRHLMSLRLLDPACGSGAFLVSAMLAFKTREMRVARACDGAGLDYLSVLGPNQQSLSEGFRRNLYGVDLDRASLEVAGVAISLMLGANALISSARSLGSELKQGNSLISLKGLDGKSDNSHFFADPRSRRPFEWLDEFPEVMRESGGFDFVVMNPPYNRLKPNVSEFLREHVAHSDGSIPPAEYADYRARIAEDVAYFRECGDFGLSGLNSIDTYRLFIDRAIKLTRKRGQLGFIVPSTLLADVSATPLRRTLITEHSVRAIYEFPEDAKVFPGVTQSVCIGVVDKDVRCRSLEACFGLRGMEEIQKGDSLKITVDAIRATAGDTLAIPRVNARGWRILRLMHANPPLGKIGWLTCRRGELDLTLNKQNILSNSFGSDLVRGSQITRYRLRSERRTETESVDLNLFMKSSNSSERLPHIHKPRIACQQVSNRAQRWRLKFAIVPAETVLANSCNYISLKGRMNRDYLLYLLGVLNSDLMNWRFNLTNANNHVSNRELVSLPIHDPVGSLDMNSEAVSDLIGEVRFVLKEGLNYSSRVESLVFALYGLGIGDARTVLAERDAEPEQMKEVLSHLRQT
jgi:Alw26I/Eco31I/Esp3I family type II restriction m6 adenine DNA methyltransferase